MLDDGLTLTNGTPAVLTVVELTGVELVRVMDYVCVHTCMFLSLPVKDDNVCCDDRPGCMEMEVDKMNGGQVK